MYIMYMYVPHSELIEKRLNEKDFPFYDKTERDRV